jgi:hypothetical protein
MVLLAATFAARRTSSSGFEHEYYETIVRRALEQDQFYRVLDVKREVSLRLPVR